VTRACTGFWAISRSRPCSKAAALRHQDRSTTLQGIVEKHRGAPLGGIRSAKVGITSLPGSPLRAKVAPRLRHAVGQRLGARRAVRFANHMQRIKDERDLDGVRRLQPPAEAGVSQSKRYVQTGALARADLRSARSTVRTPEVRRGERP